MQNPIKSFVSAPNAPTAEQREKLTTLEHLLKSYGSVCIAFSGGVDSTFLAAVAGRVLNEKALALTAQSESLAPEELAETIAITKQLGLNHEVVRTYELENPNYTANPLNRCFFCKSELMKHLLKFQAERGFNVVALGATMDDLGDFRPGEKAAQEHGAVFPLREAKLYKEDIRALSYEMGLPTWDKPGGACLSSRIPFGEHVSAEKLQQIASGEAQLHQLGFRDCRLRHHGTIARIEIPASQFQAAIERQTEIVSLTRKLGFIYATLDLQGLRSGSLHEVVKS